MVVDRAIIPVNRIIQTCINPTDKETGLSSIRGISNIRILLINNISLDDPALTIWQKPPANRLNAVVEPCSSRLLTGKTLWQFAALHQLLVQA